MRGENKFRNLISAEITEIFLFLFTFEFYCRIENSTISGRQK